MSEKSSKNHTFTSAELRFYLAL